MWMLLSPLWLLAVPASSFLLTDHQASIIIAGGAWVRQSWLSMLGAPHHSRDRDHVWRLSISRDLRIAIPSRSMLIFEICKASVSEWSPPAGTIGGTLSIVSLNGAHSTGKLWLKEFVHEGDMLYEIMGKALSGQYADNTHHYRNK